MCMTICIMYTSKHIIWYLYKKKEEEEEVEKKEAAEKAFIVT